MSSGHYPKIMTKGWNVDRLVSQELFLPAQLPPHNNSLVQILHYCWCREQFYYDQWQTNCVGSHQWVGKYHQMSYKEKEFKFSAEHTASHCCSFIALGNKSWTNKPWISMFLFGTVLGSDWTHMCNSSCNVKGFSGNILALIGLPFIWNESTLHQLCRKSIDWQSIGEKKRKIPAVSSSIEMFTKLWTSTGREQQNNLVVQCAFLAEVGNRH